MVRGLYTSATGMLAQQKKLDVVSNNIANADTTGFKRDGVISMSFEEELTRRLNDKTQAEGVTIAKKIGDMSLGTYVEEVYTDFTQSNLKQTDNTLDVALDTTGFFAVNVPIGTQNTEKYTRDGSFTVNADGTLMTKDGYAVVGVNNNTIQLPTGVVFISEDGEVYVNEEYVDTLKVVDFENPESLRKFGYNFLETTDESIQKEYTGNIRQGFLEGSNVNSVQEMVKMINIMRAYEVNQKMVQTHDQTLSKAVNEIGI